MSIYPSVQEKLRFELDQVLKGRLPSINDRKHLPYVNATIKEALRWHPALPLGIARRSRQSTIYKGVLKFLSENHNSKICVGYFIPKHTVIIPNVW